MTAHHFPEKSGPHSVDDVLLLESNCNQLTVSAKVMLMLRRFVGCRTKDIGESLLVHCQLLFLYTAFGHENTCIQTVDRNRVYQILKQLSNNFIVLKTTLFSNMLANFIYFGLFFFKLKSTNRNKLSLNGLSLTAMTFPAFVFCVLYLTILTKYIFSIYIISFFVTVTILVYIVLFIQLTKSDLCFSL